MTYLSLRLLRELLIDRMFRRRRPSLAAICILVWRWPSAVERRRAGARCIVVVAVRRRARVVLVYVGFRPQNTDKNAAATLLVAREKIAVFGYI